MDEQKAFIEKFAVYFQETGWAKMDGRIIAWLLICNPPHQNLNSIVHQLQASKSTISVAMRQLIHSGWVERISLPGDRCDYFRLREDFYSSSIEFFTSRLLRLGELAQEGLTLLEGSGPAHLKRLQKAHEVFSLLGGEMMKFIKSRMGDA